MMHWSSHVIIYARVYADGSEPNTSHILTRQLPSAVSIGLRSSKPWLVQFMRGVCLVSSQVLSFPIQPAKLFLFVTLNGRHSFFVLTLCIKRALWIHGVARTPGHVHVHVLFRGPRCRGPRCRGFMPPLAPHSLINSGRAHDSDTCSPDMYPTWGHP